MGFACPDTAACDAKYYGFFNQVYGAAWQLKRYANPPGTSQYYTWYAPGKSWNVRYHPNVACGSSPVLIQNQATANLYYYTPYQPNAASLAAGTGTGDSCSSYGNRNFYRYFADWFGSTQYNLKPAIVSEWARLGGAIGVLGWPSAAERRIDANGGGYLQPFERGTIWWKEGATAAHGLGASQLRTDYFNAGGPSGPWGWPTAPSRCGLIDSGCLMAFEAGTVGTSPATGSRLIPASLAVEWNRVGAVTLGYPIAEARCGLVEGGCLMPFQRGTIGYSPASGAVALSRDVAAEWNRVGAAGIGYPKAAAVVIGANGGGSAQEFTRGTVWSSSTGTFAMGLGPFRDNYLTAGGPSGPWGWPAGAARCGMVDGGCLMNFQSGTIGYSAATGSVLIPGAIAAEWNRLGAAALGYPRTPAQSVNNGVNGVSQVFTRALVVVSPLAAVTIPEGAFRQAYSSAGGPSAVWGWPLAQPRCGMVDNGCLLASQNGTVAFSPTTGARLLPHEIAREWNRIGAITLGYPTSDATTNGTVTTQQFQRGTIIYDSATRTYH